jgi:repressor LexA
MTTQNLSPKQKQVLEWIEAFLARNHTLPSRREIAEGLGLSSPATVQQHIEALEKKGFLKRDEARGARALQWTAESRKFFKKTRDHQNSVLQLATATPTHSTVDSIVQTNEKSTETEIPWLGTIAAGYPIEVFPTDRMLSVPLSYFSAKSSTQMRSVKTAFFALTVRGDSMLNEGIFPDDVVILEKTQFVKSGHTVAALLNGEATLKTYVKNASSKKTTTIELHPANPNYPIIKVGAEDRFEVQGVLVGLIRKYKIS